MCVLYVVKIWFVISKPTSGPALLCILCVHNTNLCMILKDCVFFRCTCKHSKKGSCQY